jgi:hypothetical protein
VDLTHLNPALPALLDVGHARLLGLARELRVRLGSRAPLDDQAEAEEVGRLEEPAVFARQETVADGAGDDAGAVVLKLPRDLDAVDQRAELARGQRPELMIGEPEIDAGDRPER